MERGRRDLKEAKPGARKVETTMSYLCDEDANIFVRMMMLLYPVSMGGEMMIAEIQIQIQATFFG